MDGYSIHRRADVRYAPLRTTILGMPLGSANNTKGLFTNHKFVGNQITAIKNALSNYHEEVSEFLMQMERSLPCACTEDSVFCGRIRDYLEHGDDLLSQ